MDSPDVVCIVETWLDGEICDQELVIDGYCVVRRDRNRHGGGVLMYIRASLEYNVLPVSDNQLEFLPISVNNHCSHCKHTVYEYIQLLHVSSDTYMSSADWLG